MMDVSCCNGFRIIGFFLPLELRMHLRHDADYGLIYDQESAETTTHHSQQFLSVAKKLLSS